MLHVEIYFVMKAHIRPFIFFTRRVCSIGYRVHSVLDKEEYCTEILAFAKGLQRVVFISGNDCRATVN